MATGLVEVVGRRARRGACRRRRCTRGPSPARCAAPWRGRTASNGVPRTRLPARRATEHRLRPAPEAHLVLHPHRPQHRRVEVPRRPWRRLPPIASAWARASGSEQQPGDLVLVLVGHQLVQVAGHRVGELGDGRRRSTRGDHRRRSAWRTRPTGRRARSSVSRSSSGRSSTGRQLRRRPRRSVVAGSDIQLRPQREGRQVLVDGDAVELDGPLDGVDRDGDRPGLDGDAEQEDVGHRLVAEQPTRHRRGVDAARWRRGRQRRAAASTSSDG